MHTLLITISSHTLTCSKEHTIAMLSAHSCNKNWNLLTHSTLPLILHTRKFPHTHTHYSLALKVSYTFLITHICAPLHTNAYTYTNAHTHLLWISYAHTNCNSFYLLFHALAHLQVYTFTNTYAMVCYEPHNYKCTFQFFALSNIFSMSAQHNCMLACKHTLMFKLTCIVRFLSHTYCKLIEINGILSL